MSYLILLFTAAIWGFAFVAQRKGMESLDPFTFNTLRFTLGVATVWVIRFFNLSLNRSIATKPQFSPPPMASKCTSRDPVILGILLFTAVSLQQVGLLWTSAGSAGFITGLYVVFVPLIGIARRQKINRWIIMAVLMSVIGLALMNRSANIHATLGNFLVLLGAVFWALHVQAIDKLTSRHPSLDLALGQYTVCMFLSLLASILYQMIVPGDIGFYRGIWADIKSALIPIAYAGVMSVGVAFTLQLHAQKKVQPHAAAVILCLEGVFAMLGGILLLGEKVSWGSLLGAISLFGAMIITILSEHREFLIDKKHGR